MFNLSACERGRAASCRSDGHPAAQTAFQGCAPLFSAALSWALLSELMKPIVALMLDMHYVYDGKSYLSISYKGYVHCKKKKGTAGNESKAVSGFFFFFLLPKSLNLPSLRPHFPL